MFTWGVHSQHHAHHRGVRPGLTNHACDGGGSGGVGVVVCKWVGKGN